MIKTISIDVDGVLRDFIGSVVFTYKKYYPSHIIKFPVMNYELEKSFPIGTDIDEFWREHIKEIFYDNAKLIKDADRGMRYLRRLGFNVNITTAQADNDLLKWTIKWLKKNKIKFNKLYCTSDKHLVNDYDVHIDDDPKQIVNIINAEKKVIIFTQDYNLNLDKSIENKCIRVNSWQEIIDIFEDVAKLESFLKNSISFPR